MLAHRRVDDLAVVVVLVVRRMALSVEGEHQLREECHDFHCLHHLLPALPTVPIHLGDCGADVGHEDSVAEGPPPVKRFLLRL